MILPEENSCVFRKAYRETIDCLVDSNQDWPDYVDSSELELLQISKFINDVLTCQFFSLRVPATEVFLIFDDLVQAFVYVLKALLKNSVSYTTKDQRQLS